MARAQISIPASKAYSITNVRLHASHLAHTDGLAFDADGFALASLEIADGAIAAIGPVSSAADAIDGRGGIVFPAFVDCHTHIDKGHIWPRKPNPDHGHKH